MNAQQPNSDSSAPKELYPGHATEQAALESRATRARQIQSEPLPGPLRQAFGGEPRRVHGFLLQDVSAWMVSLLRRIDSPLLAMVKIYQSHANELSEIAQLTDAALQKAARDKIQQKIVEEIEALQTPPDAAMETVLIFISGCEEIQSLLDSPNGRELFTRAARKMLGFLHPLQLGELEHACAEHFTQSFSTALQISAVKKENAQTVFTPPPPRTASAGGSK